MAVFRRYSFIGLGGRAGLRGQQVAKRALRRLLLLLVLWLVAFGGWAQVPLLELGLQGASSSLADQTSLYLQAGATLDFDANYDATKLPNTTGLNLASLTPMGQQLAISGLPPTAFAAPLTVGLFVGVPQDDQYTLQVNQLVNFGFSNVYIIDDELQTRQLLATGTTYSFVLNGANTGGTYFTNSRFFLVFEPTQTPLPVALVAFSAQRQGADGLLAWATASELRNAYFEVESSLDGSTFAALARVAGAGTTTAAHAYQYLDLNLARYAAPQVYYRLRQVDADGTSAYSPVRTLAVPRATTLLASLGPSPGLPLDGLMLTIATDQAGPAAWLLTDGLGRTIRQQEMALSAGATTQLPIGVAGLAPGLYLLRVQQGPQHQTLKMVRQ